MEDNERVQNAVAVLRAAVAPLQQSSKRRREGELLAYFHTASGSKQSLDTSLLRSHRRDDTGFRDRLATFTPRMWFGMPSALDPQVCSAKGWLNSARSELACHECSARWHVDPTASVASLVDSLLTQHAPSCSWRLMQCRSEAGSLFSALCGADDSRSSAVPIRARARDVAAKSLMPRPLLLEAAAAEHRLSESALTAASALLHQLLLVGAQEDAAQTALTDVSDAAMLTLQARSQQLCASLAGTKAAAIDSSSWLAGLVQSWCRRLWAAAGEHLMRHEAHGSGESAAAASPPPVKRTPTTAASAALQRARGAACAADGKHSENVAAAALRLAAVAVLCGWRLRFASDRAHGAASRLADATASPSSGSSATAPPAAEFECACCAGSLPLQRLLESSSTVAGSASAASPASEHGVSSSLASTSSSSAAVDALRRARTDAAIQSARAAGAAARATIISGRAAEVAAAAEAAASALASPRAAAAGADAFSVAGIGFDASGLTPAMAISGGGSQRLPVNDFISSSLASTPASAATPAVQGSPRAAGSADRLGGALGGAGGDGGQTRLGAAAAALASRKSLGGTAAVSSSHKQPLPLLLSAHQWFCPWREAATPASPALAEALRVAAGGVRSDSSAAGADASKNGVSSVAAAGSAGSSASAAWQAAVLRGAAMLSDATLGRGAAPASVAVAALASAAGPTASSGRGGLPIGGDSADRLLPLPSSATSAGSAAADSKDTDGTSKPQQLLLPGWLVASGILSVALREHHDDT